jgi:hypothetical protein
MEARCRACEIKGGPEAPCVPEGWLAAEREKGHPCPRREWTDPDDPIAAELVRLGAHAESGHLFRTLFDVATEGWSSGDRMSLWRRVSRAYADEVVRLALWPTRE